MAAGFHCSLFVDIACLLLSCGLGVAVGHGGDENGIYFDAAPMAAMAGVQVRSVAAAVHHSLALAWDGRVYSWGEDWIGELGHGDKLTRPSPTLVEGLESLRGIAAGACHSLAATQSGEVSNWGETFLNETEDCLRPIIVEGFNGVRMRRVSAGVDTSFAISEAGKLFSWGSSEYWLLGHGGSDYQPSPERVMTLRGIRMRDVSVGRYHVVALAEDGVVYAWGKNNHRATLGSPNVVCMRLPKPVEALRDVRVGSIAAAGRCSYAVADTGELWAWGLNGEG
jgi:alpha-tubulin suppressor-like RCC1 family protein